MAVKGSGRKSSAKKSAAKKSTRNGAGKSSQSARKSSGRKYSPAAGEQVETEMHEMKRGRLTSGRNGKKVTNPKQAIAIGLAKARKKGARVPAKS